MKKFETFTIVIVSFLLIFSASIAAAEVGNPFTIKGTDEFTQDDKRKLEEDLNEEMNKKLSVLEGKLDRELQSLKRSSGSGMQGLDGMGGVNGMEVVGPDGNIQAGAVSAAPSVAKTATFVGCIDEKPLFRSSKTKEQFFVTENEAKSNEDFNKMGGCSL